MIIVHSNSKFQEQFEHPSFKVCHPEAVVQDEAWSSEISRDRVRGPLTGGGWWSGWRCGTSSQTRRTDSSWTETDAPVSNREERVRRGHIIGSGPKYQPSSQIWLRTKEGGLEVTRRRSKTRHRQYRTEHRNRTSCWTIQDWEGTAREEQLLLNWDTLNSCIDVLLNDWDPTSAMLTKCPFSTETQENDESRHFS